MVRALSGFTLLKTTPKSALAALLALAVFPPVRAQPAPDYAGPVAAAQLAEPRNEETSGLAVSHRTPGLLWTHNDSGGEPVLFALNADEIGRASCRERVSSPV